jgi:hypothetical protein
LEAATGIGAGIDQVFGTGDRASGAKKLDVGQKNPPAIAFTPTRIFDFQLPSAVT